MIKPNDFLVEILTEELPPKALKSMSAAFCRLVTERLQKAGLSFSEAKPYATPRRLAVLVTELAAAQADQVIEKRGPAVSAAFDASGKPTPACVGFARSCGTTVESLTTIKTAQGEWVGVKQAVKGQQAITILPELVSDALTQLPVPKRMRWGDKHTEFSRPVHGVVMLYGDEVVPATVLGCEAGRVTRGHRFMAPEPLSLPAANVYESLLESKGHVIVDFAKRREKVATLARAAVKNKVKHGEPIMQDHLLDEVTGLVEWPVALSGQFDDVFLAVPKEVLISAMQDHQRYFPVENQDGQLLPYFIATSNLESKDASRVIHGNERVLRARLSDAAFFYETDKKQTLASRLDRLSSIIFQAKLGTLHDKAARLAALTTFLAKTMGGADVAERAGWLAKADLVTDMVGEFPELQGVMGGYYARNDGEPAAVASAISEHYQPRFAGDVLPMTPAGQALAIADRLDLLVGAFGMNQVPTGDKDPFGLRRAALGVLRILIEKQINLDLAAAMQEAVKQYQVTLENKHVVEQAVQFTLERLRAWYQDQGIAPDVFAAVAALNMTNPLDIDRRIRAVQVFRELPEAQSLSAANKRVSNILSKCEQKQWGETLDKSLFENEAETVLATMLEEKSKRIYSLSAKQDYETVLRELATLRQPVDSFFDQVMVMTDDLPRRENRLCLLSQLRAMFLQVADIAMLQ